MQRAKSKPLIYETVAMDIDDALEVVGGYGRAQRRVFYVVGLYQVLTALHILIASFIGADPGWTCRVSVVDEKGATSVSVDPAERCSRYELGNCSPDYSPEFTSIVTEWDLICAKSSLPYLSQSTIFIGQMTGIWLLGSLSEVYGRRKVFFVSIVLTFLVGMGYSLSTGFYMFAFFRILSIAALAGGVVSYVLVMEMLGVSERDFAGIMFASFFSVGFVVLSILAYFIRAWRTLGIVCSLIGLLFLAGWRLIPESPRWLLVNGREEEARKVLEEMARINGTELPPSFKLKKPPSQSDRRVSILDLLKGKNIRRRTIILFWTWFANCVVYYGLSLNAGNLGNNRYISFSLSGVVEVPAIVLSYYLVRRSGRIWTHGSFLLIGGAGCLGWSLLYWAGVSLNVRMVLALIGKFSVAGSFAVIYLITTELFPTQVRSLGMVTSNFGARFGGILSPVILMLGQINVALPMLLLGVIAIVVGVLSLSLPETLNRPLPETLQDIDNE